MEGKKVKDTSVIMSHAVSPQDANVAGNVHGGVIMKHIDTAAGVVAARHARCNAVTASIDRLDFHNPAFIGELLTIKASLNLVGKTSMEIGATGNSKSNSKQDGHQRFIHHAPLIVIENRLRQYN